MLLVDGEQGSSHQAMLALGALADAPQFPGAAAELLFAPLEGVEFPVDAVLHSRWLSNRDALRQVRKRIADVEHAYSEQLEGSAFGPGLKAEEDRALAREYEAKLQAGAHPAMLRGWVGLALGAPTREELERRVAVLREHYGDIQLHRPAGLQHQLFFDHLPRPDGGLTARLCAADHRRAVRRDGRDRDPRRRLCSRPVSRLHAAGACRARCAMTRPPRRRGTARPRCCWSERSGRVKPSAHRRSRWRASAAAAWSWTSTPKPDHGWQNLPELEDRLRCSSSPVTPSQQGALDPLLIGLAEMREELACSYLLELLRDPPPSWENAIGRAVKDTVREGSHSLRRVVERLCSSEQQAAREAGEALEVIGDFGLARLGFGAGQHTLLEATRSVTTIRMPGLTLPDPAAARDTYTVSERVSVATLGLVAAYSLRLIAHDRSRHKIVLLDEIWFLLGSPQGRAIINRLVRLGRAFNATLLLGTQRVADLGELSTSSASTSSSARTQTPPHAVRSS